MHDQTHYPFPHMQLDVYRVALELLRAAKALADRLPRGWSTLADHLRRSAVSVVMNIGEGANRYSARQKHQRFVDARGEAGEVASAAHAAGVAELVPMEEAEEVIQLAGRVAAMLTGMLRRLR